MCEAEPDCPLATPHAHGAAIVGPLYYPNANVALDELMCGECPYCKLAGVETPRKCGHHSCPTCRGR